MSWSEVKKINSNFVNEPLDFNNYINDISTFNANSYVLDEMNEDLWRTLLKESLVMFGHLAIHQVIYNRMTDDDIDIMINGNAKLGQSFNSFYRTNRYTSGPINIVLKDLENDDLGALEVKILHGICRYLTEHTQGDSGVGAWLALVYNEPTLSTYPTLVSIMSDTTLWNNVIMNNTPLRTGICASAVGSEYAAQSLTGTVFEDYIETVCTSTAATFEILDNLSINGRLSEFWANAVCAAAIFDNENSMNALVYHTTAFKAMCSNTDAISVLCEHTTYYDIIFNSWNTSGNTEATLANIKSDLNTLQAHVAAMPAASHNIRSVSATQDSIDFTIADIQNMNSKADVLAANFDALNTSETAWQGIANSETAMTKIAASSIALNKICLSLIARDKIYANTTAISILASSPLVVTSTKSGNGYSDIYANKFYCVKLVSPDGWLSSGYYHGVRYIYESGATSTSTKLASGGNSTYVIERFGDNLDINPSYSSGGYDHTVTVYYIPLGT